MCLYSVLTKKESSRNSWLLNLLAAKMAACYSIYIASVGIYACRSCVLFCRLFSELLKRYKSHFNMGKLPDVRDLYATDALGLEDVTAFVPSDTAMSSINVAARNRLLNDIVLLQKVSRQCLFPIL